MNVLHALIQRDFFIILSRKGAWYIGINLDIRLCHFRLYLWLYALFLHDGTVQHFNIHVNTNRINKACLLRSQHISGTTYGQIAHGDFIAAAQLGEFLDGF